MTSLPTERVAILATIDPDAYGTGTQTSDWVNVEEWGQLMAVVYSGIIVTSGKIDAQLRQATSSTGANTSTIAGKAITQISTVAGNDKQCIITLKPEELNVAGGYSFVALKMTFTTAGADAGGAIYGLDCRHGPASDFDLSSVSQIVN